MLKYQGSGNHNVHTSTKNPSRTNKVRWHLCTSEVLFQSFSTVFFLLTINGKWDNNNIPFRFAEHCLSSNTKTTPLTSHMPRKEPSSKRMRENKNAFEVTLLLGSALFNCLSRTKVKMGLMYEQTYFNAACPTRPCNSSGKKKSQLRKEVSNVNYVHDEINGFTKKSMCPLPPHTKP